jgi:hypothetical protein
VLEDEEDQESGERKVDAVGRTTDPVGMMAM